MSTNLNRIMKVDNTPLIVAVLKGELLPYFNPVDNETYLLNSGTVSRSPAMVDGMTPLNFHQAVEYKGWSRADVNSARTQVQIKNGAS